MVSCGRTYLEEQLRIKKGVDEDLEDDLIDLQAIMGLGKKEAADIISEVTSKAYRSTSSLMYTIHVFPLFVLHHSKYHLKFMWPC